MRGGRRRVNDELFEEVEEDVEGEDQDETHGGEDRDQDDDEDDLDMMGREVESHKT